MVWKMEQKCHVQLSVNIGFIGAGNMAKAIGEGMINSGMLKPSQLYISAPSNRNLDTWKALGAHTSNKNGFVVEHSDIVFIAVKPHILDSAVENMKATLSQAISSKLFVSVLAGTSLEVLEQKLCEAVSGARVIRVMPNTPMMVGAGVSVYSGGRNATSEDLTMVENILSVAGISEMVPEYLINAAGAVASSGPAFVYIMIEALSDGAVKMGLPRAMALQFSAQTVFGAAKMVLQTGRHPAQLKDEVCSAGGSTITGVHAMECGGVRNALMNAVEAAAKKSAELCPKK